MGHTIQLYATQLDQYGYNDYVWSTSDPSVAVVNSMSGSNAATFRAVGKGSVTITVIPTMERMIKATGVLTVQ